MNAIRVGAVVMAAAVGAASVPAWAGWNNEPYSYRSGGSVGMSTAYRQAYIDQQITGNRPRNLMRGPDGSLVTVIEKDRQAFVATPQPNYLVNRGGAAAGIAVGGIGFGIGLASAVDGWAVPLAGLPAGAARSPIEAWTAQLQGLAPLQ